VYRLAGLARPVCRDQLVGAWEASDMAGEDVVGAGAHACLARSRHFDRRLEQARPVLKRPLRPSWPGLSRPSTWIPGTSPGMTDSGLAEQIQRGGESRAWRRLRRRLASSAPG